MIKTICIVRLSALGDVLMLVPLVRALQDQLPGVAITWVISRPAYDLVADMAGVEFIVINKPENLNDYWQFWRKLQGRQFDVLLAAQASLRANLLYPFIKAKRKIGYDNLRAKDAHNWFIKEKISPGNDHTLESFLKFLSPLGLSIPSSPRWDMPVSPEDFEWAKAHLPSAGIILAVNAAASKPERSWSVERYISVLQQAQEKWPVKIVLTGGPGAYDRELANAILAQVDAVDLVGKTKPKQLLAVITLADILLCPDTGPAHMGAAMNTPVIALHAVTSAHVSGPYTFRHLAVDYYPEAVRKVLNTTPEKNIWGTHAHGTETMQLIPVTAVMERLGQVVESLEKKDNHKFLCSEV